MTSSNIDPVTGRAISGDERDTIGLDGPDYAGDADSGYATDTTNSGSGTFGDRDYTGGTSSDSTTDEAYITRTGFEPSVGSADVGSTVPDYGHDADFGDDSTSGAVKDQAKQVAGQVADQAGSVKETVAEQAGAVKDTVAEKAGQVKEVAVQRAADVAGVTKDELSKLASDARSQIQTLWDQAAGQLREQAGTGQHQLADLVHGLAGELGELASKAESDGPITSLVKQAAYRGGELSKWLSEAETGDVLTELRRFARKRPVVFLAGAALAGVVVGRLSRGLMAAAKTEQENAAGARYEVGYRADTDGSGLGYGVADATTATTGVVTVPPVSYAEVPDFSTAPPSTVDTGFPGEFGDDTHVPPRSTGGDYR